MVTTDQIKQLRERTGAGIMDSKKALEQSDGDMSAAEKLLKEWGLASAAKKAGREASQGIVDTYIHAGGRIGALVEVNCETDFVARTDDFKTLVHEIAMQVCAMNPSRISSSDPTPNGADADDVPLLDQPFIRDGSKTIQDLINDSIAKLRENIVVRRFARFELGGQ
jgi:elongation factor Ts